MNGIVRSPESPLLLALDGQVINSVSVRVAVILLVFKTTSCFSCISNWILNINALLLGNFLPKNSLHSVSLGPLSIYVVKFVIIVLYKESLILHRVFILVLFNLI